MTEKTYTRLELAKNQLQAAIALIINGHDRYSAISLAGAADVILTRLVSNIGQETFTEYSMTGEEALGIASREEFGRVMNDTCHINDMKHMDKGEDGYIELDPFECALAATMKALANYAILVGKDALVLAFLQWVKKNLDPKKYNVDCDPNWRAGDPVAGT